MIEYIDCLLFGLVLWLAIGLGFCYLYSKHKEDE